MGHVKLRNDDWPTFLNEWDETLQGLVETPPDSYLLSLFDEQIADTQHEAIKEMYNHYRLITDFDKEPKTYARLRELVEDCLERKERRKVRDALQARHDKRSA